MKMMNLRIGIPKFSYFLINDRIYSVVLKQCSSAILRSILILYFLCFILIMGYLADVISLTSKLLQSRMHFIIFFKMFCFLSLEIFDCFISIAMSMSEFLSLICQILLPNKNIFHLLKTL